MANFSLKFDSNHGDVDFSNAISIDELGELLKSLYSAIGATKSDRIILSTVVDNCYELGISTLNTTIPSRAITLAQNIREKSDLELKPKESAFKTAIAKSLKPDWFLEVLNEKGIPVVSIPYGFSEKTIETYNSIKSIEGVVTEIGNKELGASSLHIYMSDNIDYKIFINLEQNNALAGFYRNGIIRAKLNLKKSLITDKVLSARLIGFSPKSESNFIDSLNELDFSDINFIND